MDSIDATEGRLPTFILVANALGRDALVEVEEHDGLLHIHVRPTATPYPCVEPHFMSAGKSRVVGLEEEVLQSMFESCSRATRPTPANFANRLPAHQSRNIPPTVLTVLPEHLLPRIRLTNPMTYVEVFYDEREGLTRVRVRDKGAN